MKKKIYIPLFHIYLSRTMLDAIIEKFQEGLARAITEIVVGLIPPIVLSAAFNSELFPSVYIWVFYLISGVISLIGILDFFKEMSFWGISYIIGWIFGVFLLLDTGLLELTDFLVYFIAPLGYLVYKIIKFFLER